MNLSPPMNYSDFGRIYEKHGVIYTNGELIYSAYTMGGQFTNWGLWLDTIRSSMGNEVVEKLIRVSDEILSDFKDEQDGFGLAVVTVEVSAVETVDCYEEVPKKFLEFLSDQ